MEIARLRIEREEAVLEQLGRTDAPRKLVAELVRPPVAHVEERARLAEATLAQLVRETPEAQTFASWTMAVPPGFSTRPSSSKDASAASFVKCWNTL